MASKVAYPPIVHHASTRVTPKAAQEKLAAFLAQTPTTPYLHPDAILSQSGIQFPAQSGPQGGLALHHLKRIEAGLRGENLVAQSKEELNALFADDPALPAGDDEHLDALIDNTRKTGKRSRNTDKIEQWQDGSETGDTAVSGALDPNEYAEEQTEVLEEIGNDTLAGQGEQVSSVPRLKTGKRSEMDDKKARKDAKKARKQQEKKDKLAQKSAAG